MSRLSSPLATMKSHYEVVVVGSGYGGSIAASRLSRAGLRVCLLERGREFQPGDFPDTLGKAVAESQLDLPFGHFRSHTALFDFRLNRDMSAVVGCGLGGTSLINANVVLRPQHWVFKDLVWPAPLRVPASLNDAFQHVEDMLAPQPYSPNPARESRPLDAQPVPKLLALAKMSKGLGASSERGVFETPKLAVNFNPIVNRLGVEQGACALCGDCVSGCNYGAKNTLLMNYLPDAKCHGAEIYTEVAVRYVKKQGNDWLVHYDLPDAGRATFDAPTMVVRAGTVVLAAGTFGSTEILLRSRDHGLSVSSQLGRHFSGNGDVLAVAYNTAVPVNGIGFGQRQPRRGEPVGPCITGTINLSDRTKESEGLTVQEGSIPGALAGVIPFVLALATVWVGRAPLQGIGRSVTAEIARWRRLLGGPRTGAVRNSQTLLVMGHDDAAGELTLEGDRVRLHWPNHGQQPLFARVDRLLHKAASTLDGIFVKNPLAPVTVHPLGGCRMAEDAAHGVVDHEGRVFNATSGTDTHQGLYVADGAVVPRALGVNPLFTISALAERTCALLAEKLRGKIDYAFRPADCEVQSETSASSNTLRFSEALRPGLQFTERMTGYVSREDPDDNRGVAPAAEGTGLQLEMIVTVISDDLESLINDSKHSARLVGTVSAQWLSSPPMTIQDGTFHWFVLDPDQVETRYIRYSMSVVAEDGARYRLDGHKIIRNAAVTRAWRDLTTLFVTIRRESEPTTDAWKGQLRVTLGDLLRSLRTLRARHARTLTERFDARARYIGAFAAFVRASYGRVLAPSIPATPDVPRPRPGASTPVLKPTAVSFPVSTSDTTQVHLTRYHGGRKGPVLLAPGFGVAASSFKTDTVETNLVDYLCARDYDVWLLDYRASPSYPAAREPFTIDDIARRDYPAVVRTMLACTKEKSIQAIVHCVGSLSFFMSLLSDSLPRGCVRSVIASQLGAHPITPVWNELKVALRLSTLLRCFGVTTMTTHFNPRRWSDWAIDEMLRLYPTRERCNNPVCRRILFIFGESYRHDQLNTETHDAIGRWFGDLNLRAMGHLSRMVGAGHVVDAEGQNVYLPNVRRLALPISFMHGTLNQEFLPQSTHETFEWLRRHNDPNLYRRRCFAGYGHMDCFVGKRAADDIYGWIRCELDRYNE